MNSAKSNNVYYNARIQADPLGERKVAKFSVNRVQEILTDPSDYELSIVRFQIPRTTIPMMFWKNNYWSITLKIGSSVYTEYLNFIPNTTFSGRNAIYTQQEFIDSINNAFLAAFTSLNGANTITSDFPPALYYDPVSRLCTLEAQQNYITDGIDIYFNRNLHNLLLSFQNFFNSNTSQLAYKIIVADRITNTSSLNGQLSYLMIQDFPTTGSWSMLNTIRIETDSIPITRELDGDQKDISSSLLTDYNVQQEVYDTSDFIYFPQGPLRYIDLNSKYPLNQIDFSVFYETKDYEKIPLEIQASENLSVKFQFRKKLEFQIADFINKEISEISEQI